MAEKDKKEFIIIKVITPTEYELIKTDSKYYFRYMDAVYFKELTEEDAIDIAIEKAEEYDIEFYVVEIIIQTEGAIGYPVMSNLVGNSMERGVLIENNKMSKTFAKSIRILHKC